jgi:hypothetical protein
LGAATAIPDALLAADQLERERAAGRVFAGLSSHGR